jgi:1-acyl-sn-glycerol-3-phosphate acyltransferase
MVYPFTKLFFPLFHPLFVKKVTGLENIPKKGPFIIAANHQSHIDGFLIGSYVIQKTNKKIHFLAKKEFTSYFGQLFENIVYKKWVSVLFVEKEGTRHRGKIALLQASGLLDFGEIVGVFPEGSRTYDGSLQEGRTGVVRIVLGTKKYKRIPIIPIGIRNAHVMLPRGCMVPRFWKTRVSLSFGKPFYVDTYRKKKMTKKMLRDATTVVMNKISHCAGLPYDH